MYTPRDKSLGELCLEVVAEWTLADKAGIPKDYGLKEVLHAK